MLCIEKKLRHPDPLFKTAGSKEKPALQGVRNKQRKGVQKANAKFEPQAFRDQLVKHLESVPPSDFEAVAAKLDVLGNQLDYRKYEQQLFEILLAGGLLNPGGGYVDDGPKSTFSVVGSATEPVDLADMKKIVDVFNKLLRRYKYLQKPFEETSLRGILQYANKFSTIEQEKLAVATAVFVQTGLVPVSVLTVLKKEHLIKENVAVTFFTNFCKTYLLSESLEHLASTLRKGGVSDFEGFFPAGHQTPAEFAAHFKAAGLGGVVDFYTKQKTGQAKEEMLARLKELVAEDADADDLLTFLEQQHKRAILPDADFVAVIWQGLFGAVDAEKSPETVLEEIKDACPILEGFCTKPSTEVALINTIQVWTFEHTTLMPIFPKILKVMYSTDVLSDQSIIYWHGKGAKTQGKAQFLAATLPLVTFLKEQEDEDESDDE